MLMGLNEPRNFVANVLIEEKEKEKERDCVYVYVTIRFVCAVFQAHRLYGSFIFWLAVKNIAQVPSFIDRTLFSLLVYEVAS